MKAVLYMIGKVLMNVIPWAAAHAAPKGCSETAGRTEACLHSNLSDGILSAGEQSQAAADAVVWEITGDCDPCHLFEKTAACFAGRMNQGSQFLKRYLL